MLTRLSEWPLTRLAAQGAMAVVAIAMSSAPTHTVSEIDYLGTYSGGSRVSVWRGQAADIVVHGQFLDLSTSVEVINSATNAVAVAVAAVTTDRIGGGDTHIVIHLTSGAEAALGNYQIRIHYLVETNGPDHVDLRLYDKESVTSAHIVEAPLNGGRYAVGQPYTLVANGSGLAHATFNPSSSQMHGVTLLATLSRSSGEATFAVRFDSSGANSIGAWDFHDDAMLPSHPTASQRFTAGFGPSSGGSNFFSLVAGVVPTVASVSPTALAIGATATASGSRLLPRGYGAEVEMPARYYALAAGPIDSVPAVKGNGTLSFPIPSFARGDSGRIVYRRDGSSPVDSLATFVAPMPTIGVTGSPAVIQVGASLGSTLLFQGTSPVLGRYLVTTGTPSCATKSCSTVTVLPTASFAGTTIPASRAIYAPTAQVDVPATGAIQVGTDSVYLNVPAIVRPGASVADTMTGTLTLTTAIGSTTQSNVFYAARPVVTAVQVCCNGAQTVTNSTLVRGVQYKLVGNALHLVVAGHSFGGTQVTLNGTSIPTTLVGGLSIAFTVPSSSTSGPLVVTTLVGSTTVGNFTVSDPVAEATIVGMQLSPSPAPGGQTVTATIAVNANIPAGGSAGNLILTMQPVDSSVILPGAVPVTSNPVIVPIATRAVSASHSTLIFVNNEPTSTVHTTASANITVQPPSPTAVTLSGGGSTTGGQSVAATVQLNTTVPASANIPIAISSSDPTTASVPTSVIASGAAISVPVTTSIVPSTRTVTISATSNGQTKSASLTVNPPVVSGIALAHPSNVAGVVDTATIALTIAPSAPVSAVIQCSDAALVCPASVTVSGASAKFVIGSVAVPASRTATVAVTLNGATVTTPITIVPLAIQSVTISPTSVSAGASSSMTIQLNGSPSGGGTLVTVQLSSGNAAVAVISSSVNFSFGTITQIVPITTRSPQTQSNTVTLTASFTQSTTFGPNTSTVSKTLVVNP